MRFFFGALVLVQNDFSGGPSIQLLTAACEDPLVKSTTKP
jgi:hypothetical protein